MSSEVSERDLDVGLPDERIHTAARALEKLWHAQHHGQRVWIGVAPATAAATATARAITATIKQRRRYDDHHNNRQQGGH